MNIELLKWNEAYFAAIGEIFTRCDRSYLSDSLPMPALTLDAPGALSDESTGIRRGERVLAELADDAQE